MGQPATSRLGGSAEYASGSSGAIPSCFEVASALLSPEALSEVRRSPRFKAAALTLAANHLAQDDDLDPHTRWLVRDGGRLLLYGAALMIQSVFGRVTVLDLQQTATLSQLCSAGRVIAFVDYAVGAGQIRIPPGEEVWTRRPLELRSAFWRYGEDRLWGGLAAVNLFEARPPHSPQADRRPGAIAAFNLMARLLGALPHLRTGRLQPMGVVLDQNAGVSILYDWALEQPPGQQALLHEVQLNRSALSRRHRVSRPHLNHLISALEAAGLATRPEKNLLVVSQALSEDLERHFAQGLQLLRGCRLAIQEVMRP